MNITQTRLLNASTVMIPGNSCTVNDKMETRCLFPVQCVLPFNWGSEVATIQNNSLCTKHIVAIGTIHVVRINSPKNVSFTHSSNRNSWQTVTRLNHVAEVGTRKQQFSIAALTAN